MSAKQHNRAEFLWDGPGGTLEIVSFHLEEEISRPYTIKVLAKSDNKAISIDEMLNKEATITLACGEDFAEKRFFKGVITDLVVGRTGHANIPNPKDPVYFYRIELRPTLWRLSYVTRSKVFQKMSVKDIVSDVLGEFGINFSMELNGTHPSRLYCLQYKESCLDFVCRLMEEEGMFFFTDHEAGTLKIGDHAGIHKECKPFNEVLYVEGGHVGKFSRKEAEHIYELEYRVRMGTGKFMFNDYNHETSTVDIKATESKGKVPQFTDFEVYEHGTKQVDAGEGKELAKWERERVEASCYELRAISNARSIMTGFKFTLKNHFNKQLEQSWVIYRLEIDADGQGNFRAEFCALPANIVFRPQRLTPRPKVQGLQTAVVTGPAGSKVYLDDLGRCKLQFHWDREGKKDENCSMWVRVSNGYAGKDYGIQWIPRVGHEVLVEFCDGDPDRPVVIGRVYNDFNTPPLGPPKKWQNIIKTIKDNHIMFDDEDGKELIDIRAHKDMNTLVENDKTLTVGNDNTDTVKHNKYVTVEGDIYQVKVTKGDYEETVKGNFTTKVESGNMEISVDTGHMYEYIQDGKAVIVTSNNYATEVNGGDYTLAVNGGIAVDSTGSITTTATSDISFQSTKFGATNSLFQVDTSQVIINTSSISVTASSLTFMVGAASMNMSASGITLSCGGGSVNIGPAGVTISGPTVTLTGMIKHNC